MNGRLQILGRLDDVIVTGGLKITPTRLEAAIGVLTTVAEVLVVGLADPEWGQRVAALVVPADPREPPGLQDLLAACAADGIEPALRPRSLALVDRLPLRGPGKPDRIAAAAIVAALAPPAPSPH